MAKEVTRSLDKKIARELWARAAGRCEFNSCNRPLYKSPITQEQGNISEIAHIWSFSEKGPRGWGTSSKENLNKLSNLMLLCHDCHKTIDLDKKGERYSAKMLRQWKDEHEKRVAIVTGINPSKKSHVLLYGANIGDEKSSLQTEHAKEALFPHWYPAEEHALCLSMNWEGKDDRPDYWKTEERNLRESFVRYVIPFIKDANPCHFSIFAFAPMPLLVLLGSLMTDKIGAQVYQLHREPMTWHWLRRARKLKFKVKAPKTCKFPPVLNISLSGAINNERINAVLGERVSIWRLSIDEPHNDFLKSKEQLVTYREVMRRLIGEINKRHQKHAFLSIFPAMPVACSVELGRIRMPKADLPWVIYDQNSKKNSFIKTLKIGGR